MLHFGGSGKRREGSGQDLRTVLARGSMKQALAIYDMDRTITRRATYTPFLIHAAWRLAPWRLVLLPFVLLSMVVYGLKLIDRARLKEINYRLLIGGATGPK